MFKCFFLNKKWQLWSIPGSILLIASIWYSVQIDLKINDWYGNFYNLIQKAFEKPNNITFDEFLSVCYIFIFWAGIWVALQIIQSFFSSHYIFRWRTAMNEYYTANWSKLRTIEGASQRVQEDTMRFATIMESLGVSFVNAIITLCAFLPLLWELSDKVTELPWIGHVPKGLVWLVLIISIVGTGLLALVGRKLPRLQFNNQLVEAAYRKELVLGEDNAARAQLPVLQELYDSVRRNYFTLYLHYLYFNLVRYSYIQSTVLIPYIALAPSLIAGAITYGLMQRIVSAFSQVKSAFQFLLNSWSSIVELISIYQRLRAFEKTLHDTTANAGNTEIHKVE